MKKLSRIIAISVFTLIAAAAVAVAAGAAAPEPVNFGQDANKMQWYLVNYGKNDECNFASARKYYTNPDEKENTIGLICEKFGIDSETASGLYFTEYGYAYSADGKEFAVTYISHYDMGGQLIKSTEFGASDREYVKMSKEMIPFKAYPYAIGKLPAKKAAPKK
ncbi:MAG: hypothetical protein ACOX5A_11600 [Aminivibrio sp.]|jgi:hypothetical protein|nr:hypothetical protein [Synergistaceae bacterium]